MLEMSDSEDERNDNSRLVDTDEDYQLWWLVLHTRRAMRRARAKELLKYGITPAEAAVLFSVMSIGDAATPAQISRWLLREPHSVSGLLDRMQETGLITKTKDLYRKNLVRIALTEKGQKAYRESAVRESIHDIVSCLPVEERQLLKSLLSRLRDRALAKLGVSKAPNFP